LSAYADTSFLVSLYAPDVNSADASAFMQRTRLPLLLTPLGELELVNALHLRVFRRELSAVEVQSAVSIFRVDLEAGVFALKSLTVSAFERAKKIARAQTAELGTRTLDVLHVASALVLRAETFCTFDRRQAALARAEKLRTPLIVK
jgi:predicted nucleic acid-binding protein